MGREPYTGNRTGNGADEGRVPGGGKLIIGPMCDHRYRSDGKFIIGFCENTGIEAVASL